VTCPRTGMKREVVELSSETGEKRRDTTKSGEQEKGRIKRTVTTKYLGRQCVKKKSAYGTAIKKGK